jgi:hypothetical protein
VAGGKDGRAFLLNRDALGGYTQNGSDNVLQTIDQGSCWCGPGYFVGGDGNPYVLTGGAHGITSWKLQTSPTPQLTRQSTTGSAAVSGLPWYGGSIPVVSSNGTTPGTAIMWFLQHPQFSSDTDPGTPLTLMAYDASSLQTPILSIQGGTWVHASHSTPNLVPTIANGLVYVASNKQLDVFGLLPPNGTAARAALPQPLVPSKPDAVTCAPIETSLAAVNPALRTHQFFGTVCNVHENELQISLRSGRSITLDIRQASIRERRVSLTPGRAVHVSASIDEKGAAHALQITPAHHASPGVPADR